MLNNKNNHKYKTKTLSIIGMSCAACASSVEEVASNVKGIHECRVNFATHQLWISYDELIFSSDELKKAIQLAGYDIVLEDQADPFEIRRRIYIQLLRKTLLSFVFALPLLIISMGWMHESWASWVTAILATPLVIYFGKTFHLKAFKGLTTLTFGMDTLVSLGSIVAYGYSIIVLLFKTSHLPSNHVYFESAGMIVAFILLGKTLEEHARYKASVSLRGLMNLQDTYAYVIKNGKLEQIPVAMVNRGDWIWVPPSSNFSLDGVIREGNTAVDESMITGEFLPVDKKVGDRVFAGTRNIAAAVSIEVIRTAHETLLASMVQRIQEALSSKAPAQQLADKISSVFVPIILVLSSITFIAWMLLDGSLDKAIYASVAVLIIACPCAMGLATPVAVVAAVGNASKHGILVKNAHVLDRLSKVTHFVIDKTGTLTQGHPKVKKIEGLKEPIYQSILYSMELHSDHPLAKALIKHLEPHIVQPLKLTNVKVIPGEGITAIWNGTTYVIGKSSMFTTDALLTVDEWQKQGGTVVFFGTPSQILAYIVFEDSLKPQAYNFISQLRQRKISVMMATGDSEQYARTIADELEIPLVRAGLLPHEKADLIKSLQKQGEVVAMVGDGVNDAESMAIADVSIAMGDGSDMAKDIADITLIKSDLLKIPMAIDLSKKTNKIIRQNLFWAFGYNVAAIPLAAGLFYPFTGWLLNPMIAAAAMAFSSVTVVLNSLRLRN